MFIVIQPNNKPINKNNIFLQKVTVFPKACTHKNTGKHRIVLLFLQIPSMFGLVEDSWILISASVFSLLQYHKSYCLWKTQLYSHEGMRLKKVNNENSFASHIKVSPDYTLRISALNQSHNT